MPDRVCLTCQPPHLDEGEPVAPTPSAENRPPSYFGVLRGCYTYGALSNPASAGCSACHARVRSLCVRRVGAPVRVCVRPRVGPRVSVGVPALPVSRIFLTPDTLPVYHTS